MTVDASAPDAALQPVRVTFRVRSPSGEHVGARLQLLGPAKHETSALIDVMSTATAELEPGLWVVRLGERELALRVAPGAPRTVELDLSRATTTIRVEAANGAPVADAGVFVRAEGPRARTAGPADAVDGWRLLGRTDDDGALPLTLDAAVSVHARAGPAVSSLAVARPGTVVTLGLPRSAWLRVTTQPALECGWVAFPGAFEPTPLQLGAGHVGAPLGTVVIQVSGVSGGRAMRGRAWTRLSSEGGDLEVQLRPVEPAVSGGLVSDAGVPAGAVVSLQSPRAIIARATATDTGTFALTPRPTCPLEPLELRVDGAWRTTRRTLVQLGDPPLTVDVELAPTGDADSGR